MFDNPRLNRNRRINLDDDKDEDIPPPPKLERSTGGLIPFPLKNKLKDVPMNDLMKDRIIPRHRESVLFVGASSSGKTTLLIWMLTQKHIFKDYFDKIYLFSFSGKSDPSFENLNLPKDCIITEDMINKLTEVLDKQQKVVETNGINNSKKILIIFEDVSSSPKFMRSKNFTKAFTALRHVNASVWCCCHKYSTVPRICRLNSMNLFLFPAPNSELEAISDDHMPPGLNRREFRDLVRYAWKKDKEQVKPFLYINMKTGSFNDRYRKGFSEMLELDDF
jgi:hypothetical protein